MNGRIERTDARLELWTVAESSYHAVDFFLAEERVRLWKRRGKNAFYFLAWVAYCWLVIGRAAE